MAKKFSNLKAQMPKDSQDRVEKRVADSVEEILISEIRKSAGYTQSQLAKRMGVSQPALSQMEKQKDMHFSTLRKLVKAIGGELEIKVRYHGKELKIAQ